LGAKHDLNLSGTAPLRGGVRLAHVKAGGKKQQRNQAYGGRVPPAPATDGTHRCGQQDLVGQVSSINSFTKTIETISSQTHLWH